MRLFETLADVKNHIITKYPRQTLGLHVVESGISLLAVYDKEDVVDGFIFYKDLNKNKWILLESLSADLAVRNYLEYIKELTDAIMLFNEIGPIDDEKEVDSESLGFDLD